MSVDRQTYIGLGWVIDAKEREKMLEYCGRHYPSELGAVEDILNQPVNSYISNAPTFIGDIFAVIDEGEYITLEEVMPADYDPDVFTEKYMEILDMCGVEIAPGSKWEEAKVYVIHSIS